MTAGGVLWFMMASWTGLNIQGNEGRINEAMGIYIPELST